MSIASQDYLEDLAVKPSARILVFSDSHNHSDFIIQTANKNPQIDLLLHLGDHCANLGGLASHLLQPVLGVAGNCDGSQANHLPNLRLLVIAGYRLFMAHGHQYGVKHFLSKLIEAGSQAPYCADVILFGHTHQYYQEIIQHGDSKIYLLNPGSARPNQFGWPATAALIQLDSSGINIQMLLDQI